MYKYNCIVTLVQEIIEQVLIQKKEYSCDVLSIFTS